MNCDKLSPGTEESLLVHSCSTQPRLVHLCSSCLHLRDPKLWNTKLLEGAEVAAAIYSEHIKHHHSPPAFSPPALLFQTISLSWGKCISLFFLSRLTFHISLVSASQQCLLSDGFSRKLGLAVSSGMVLYIKGGNSSPAQNVNYVTANAGGQTGYWGKSFLQVPIFSRNYKKEVTQPCEWDCSHKIPETDFHLNHRLTKSQIISHSTKDSIILMK